MPSIGRDGSGDVPANANSVGMRSREIVSDSSVAPSAIREGQDTIDGTR